ncbi:MAG: DUF2256 domain-containing protein [Planctomycetia bacterium TMED53]|nr:MAG: DUF2256 domain-containing protein [Planctomycetia bacterium TMED53]
MAKQRKKSDFQQKVCLTCGRPFSWRKKWERNWDEVRYCSARCKSATPKKSKKISLNEGTAAEKKA